MSVTELRPNGRPKTSTARPSAKEQAEAEALRAKTKAAQQTADLAHQLKAAKAAPEIAKAQADADRIRREIVDQRREEAEQRRAAQAAKEKADRSASQWRTAAKTIAVVCVVVSLPLQMMAFYSPHAWFLVLAPLVIEGLAWALLKGAEAAIDEGRPSWHYRLLALSAAVFAATVNLLHGMHTFGLATGLGGAFCSIAGPMVWDLHEHGRITRREGRPTRRQRREAARLKAAETAVAKAAREEADGKRDALEAMRNNSWPQVWERAVALAAAVGELHPSEPTWKRAWDDIHGAQLGDTAASIGARVTAKAAAKEAAKDQATAPAAPAKPQVESQLPTPRAARAQGAPDGRRANGGTPPRQSVATYPRYSVAARRAMSLAARNRRDQAAAS